MLCLQLSGIWRLLQSREIMISKIMASWYRDMAESLTGLTVLYLQHQLCIILYYICCNQKKQCGRAYRWTVLIITLLFLYVALEIVQTDKKWKFLPVHIDRYQTVTINIVLCNLVSFVVLPYNIYVVQPIPGSGRRWALCSFYFHFLSPVRLV